ncbi:unnamed protein product [Rhizophagus irregularis]|nr:unnamed protein product [Rhizophagus irregularis]
MAAPGAAKNQPHEGEPKRVNFSESEEPIKIQKRQREKSKKKERGKKEIKEIALPAPVDLQPIIKNSRGISATSRDIMFYNIPARAEMNLFDDYENEFVKDIWKVQLLIGKSDKTQSAMQVRWFPGQNKDQLDAARALDKDANDETWIVHGKGWANTSEKNTKEHPVIWSARYQRMMERNNCN